MQDLASKAQSQEPKGSNPEKNLLPFRHCPKVALTPILDNREVTFLSPKIPNILAKSALKLLEHGQPPPPLFI